MRENYLQKKKMKMKSERKLKEIKIKERQTHTKNEEKKLICTQKKCNLRAKTILNNHMWNCTKNYI